MKTKNLYFLVIYFIVICLYVYVLITKNPTRLIQSSVIFGLGFAYFSFHEQGGFYKSRLWILTAILPSIALAIASIYSWKIPDIKLITIILLAFYIPAIFGGILSRLNIRNDIKLAIVVGVVFSFISGMTRNLNHGTSASLTMYIATIAILFLYQTTGKKSYIILLPFLSIYFILNALLGTYPEVLQIAVVGLFLIILSIAIHYVVNMKSTLLAKGLYIFALTSLMAFFIWFGQENYEKWLFGKIENESIPGKVNYSFVTLDNNIISTIDTTDLKVVVLFWSEGCSSCKNEFPYFSRLAESSLSDTTTLFLAAYLSYNDRDSEYFEEVTRTKYTFSWAKTNESKLLMKELKMKGVPHLSIFNQHGEVLYNGLVCNRPWIWVNRPSKYL